MQQWEICHICKHYDANRTPASQSMILRLIEEEENLHHTRIVHNQELNLKSLRIDRRVIRCGSSAAERQSVAMASDSPLNAVASGTRMLRNQHESAQINLKTGKDVIHSKIVLRPDIEKMSRSWISNSFRAKPIHHHEPSEKILMIRNNVNVGISQSLSTRFAIDKDIAWSCLSASTSSANKRALISWRLEQRQSSDKRSGKGMYRTDTNICRQKRLVEERPQLFLSSSKTISVMERIWSSIQYHVRKWPPVTAFCRERHLLLCDMYVIFRRLRKAVIWTRWTTSWSRCPHNVGSFTSSR